MASTGARIAGTGSSVARGAATAWSNPGNITAQDSTVAECASGSSGSAYLRASNFGFSLPTGAQINGLTVHVRESETGVGNETVYVQIVDASGAPIGSSKTFTASGTTLADATLGASNDLWGTTGLTGADINDSDFGVYIWFLTTHTVQIDAVDITVEYTPVTITGSFSATEEGADAAALSGGVQVSGVLSVAETGADEPSFAGTVPIQGGLLATEVGSDTAAFYQTLPASRYWVGGTGTWDASNTANWSESSGGLGGASVPGPSDDVYIDGGSDAGGAFTVTLSGTALTCKSLTIGGLDAVLTLSGSSSQTLNVYGDLSFPSSNFVSAAFVKLNFRGTGSHQISPNGQSINGAITILDGNYSLNGNLSANNSASEFRIEGGSFTTNDYNLTVGDFYVAGTNAKTVNLGASVITLNQSTAVCEVSATNTTWNYGTAKFTNTTAATGITYGFDGLEVYDLEPEVGNAGSSRIASDTTVVNSFKVKNSAAVGVFRGTLNINSGVTVTVSGSFSSDAGTDVRKRTLIGGFSIFTSTTKPTLVVANTGTLRNTDFSYIHITGAAAPISGTNLGNSGNNPTGITFTTPKTVYWRGAAGTSNANASNVFSSISGGSGDNANYPLPQDTVVVDDNTLASTLANGTNHTFQVATLDLSQRTQAITVNRDSGTLQFTGDSGGLYLSSVVTWNATIYQTLIRSSTLFEIDSAGVALKSVFALQQNSGSGAAIPATRLLSDVVFGQTGSVSYRAQLLFGKLDCNGFSFRAYGVLLNQSSESDSPRLEVYANGGSFGAIFPDAASTFFVSSNLYNYYQESGTYWVIEGQGVAATGTISGSLTNISAQANGVNGLPNLRILCACPLQINNGFLGALDFSQNTNAHTLTLAGTLLYLYGSVFFNADLTVAASNTELVMTGSGDTVLDSKGVTLNLPLRVLKLTQTAKLTLAGDADFVAKALTLAAGTLELSGYTLKGGSFDLTSTTAKVLTFNGGAIEVKGVSGINANGGSNLVITDPATGTLKLSAAAGPVQVNLGAQTLSWPSIEIATTSQVQVVTTADQEIHDIFNSVASATVNFTAGQTFTFGAFSLSGSAGNFVTIGSLTASSQAIFSKASGSVLCDYLDIRDNNATGGATWYAGANSVNSGNTTGWIFQGAGLLLAANNLTQAASSSTGGVEVSHLLVGDNVVQSASSSPSSVSVSANLTANGATQSALSPGAALAVQHTLNAQNHSQSALSGTGSVLVRHDLTGFDSAQAATAGLGSIFVTHTLTAGNTTQTALSSPGIVTAGSLLEGSNATQSATSQSGSVSVLHVLSGNDVSQTSLADSGSVILDVLLAAKASEQTSSTTTGAITVLAVLTARSLQQSALSQDGAVTLRHVLDAKSVSQTSSTTAAEISVQSVLGARDVQQAAQSNTGALLVTHPLSGRNVSGNSASSTGQIGLSHGLEARDCTQTADSSQGLIAQIHLLSALGSQASASVTVGAVNLGFSLTARNVAQTNNTTVGAVAGTLELTGENAIQTAQSQPGAVIQIHNITGRSLSQSQASGVDQIVIQGYLLGRPLWQSNFSSSHRVEVYPVVDAPAGQGYAPPALLYYRRPEMRELRRMNDNPAQRPATKVRNRKVLGPAA